MDEDLALQPASPKVNPEMDQILSYFTPVFPNMGDKNTPKS